jgi:hypothetical protein
MRSKFSQRSQQGVDAKIEEENKILDEKFTIWKGLY